MRAASIFREVLGGHHMVVEGREFETETETVKGGPDRQEQVLVFSVRPYAGDAGRCSRCLQPCPGCHRLTPLQAPLASFRIYRAAGCGHRGRVLPRLFAQVLIHRLPADAELPRQPGLRLPRRRALPQLGDAVLTQDAFATAVGAAGLGQGDALRWRSPINARSNSANAPITDSNSCAMGLSSPVNVRCSLRNSTRTAVSARIVPTNAIRSMPDVGASYRSGWFDLGSVAPCATPST